MREVVFLRQNADKWKQFETLLRQDRATNPDQLADLFVEVTNDLSYAQTFYPQSKTTQYLNGLATEIHQAIYKNKKEERRRIFTFWTRELPLIAYQSRKAFLLSLIIVGIATTIGALSAANDDTFVRLILGDAYVNSTLESIAEGDPMAVYKQTSELNMFLAITFNNVRVSFLAFVMGLLFSIGTGYVLFQNGVMLGSFHYLFFEHDLLGASLLVVYIHGALEIPAIILAGGAGFVLGNSILFPGTHTRLHAFTQGARQGLKIIIGLVPIFITAGFLEGFVTRHTEMPMALSLTIILGSLSFILWYFVLYPHRLYHQHQHASNNSY